MVYILKSINNSNYNKLMLGASVMLGIATLGVVSNNTQADASTRNGNVITVESGDTLSEIATTYNTSIDQLVNDNNIADKNVISVGQQLTLNDTNNSQTTNTNTQPASVSQPVQNMATTQPTTQSSSQSSTTQPDSASQSVQNTTTTQATTSSSNLSSSEQEAKDWIAQRESGGSYTAQNGNYYGRYQLSSSYLNGDTSAANQEKVADEYVSSRYGSWVNAKNFWLQHNYY